jgi:hypothetical protein
MSVTSRNGPGVGVIVMVGVAVGVGVLVLVNVAVGVLVTVAVGVGVHQLAAVGVGILVGVAVGCGDTRSGTSVGGSESTLPINKPVSVAVIMVFFLSFLLIVTASSPNEVPLAPALSAISSKTYR